MFILTSAIISIFVIWTIWENTTMKLNSYTIAIKNLPPEFSGYRIARISDLYNAEIGDENESLLALLSEARPDNTKLLVISLPQEEQTQRFLFASTTTGMCGLPKIRHKKAANLFRLTAYMPL